MKSTLEIINAAWIKVKKERKLTQQDACNAMGFSSQGTFSRLLKGDMPMNIEHIFKLSQLLNTPPLELAKEELEPYANAIHSMTNDVGRSHDEKEAIITDLQERLINAGINSEVRKPSEVYNAITDKQRELLQLLAQLPIYETDFALQSLRSRVALHRGDANPFSSVGKAAVDSVNTSVAPASTTKT